MNKIYQKYVASIDSLINQKLTLYFSDEQIKEFYSHLLVNKRVYELENIDATDVLITSRDQQKFQDDVLQLKVADIQKGA